LPERERVKDAAKIGTLTALAVASLPPTPSLCARFGTRSRRRRQDPRTPDIHKKCSKRGFDGQVKAWRKQLHSLFPDDTVGPRQHGGEAVDGQGTAAAEVGDNQTQRKGAGQGSSLDYIFAPSAPETEVAGGLSEEDLYEGL